MGLGGWMLQEGYMLGINREGTQHSIKARITDLVGKEDCEKFYQLWRQNHMTRADVDLLAKSGFNSIRLPMHYNLFTLPIDEEPVKGGNTWLETGFAMVDNLLASCKANRMYLILDLHAAPGGQGKDANISDYDPAKPSLWESDLNRQKTIALWRKLAGRYAGEPCIGGYDLLNEPNWTFEGKDKNGREDTQNQPLWELYQAIGKAVREVDTHHIVIIEGNGWGNNYNGFPGPWDSNMVLSFHKYWNPNTQEAIARFLALREKHRVPVWLGESGENNDHWFRDCVALVEKNHIGWAWWPHKKVNSGSCTLTIRRPDDFRKVVEYWNRGGERPSRELAARALFDLAENAKAGNCRFNTNVVQALIPPGSRTSAQPQSATSRGGRYVKVEYPVSTDTNELQIAVTYTLWIPEGAPRLRGLIVHQHGAGTTASIEGSTAAYDLHWQALARKWDCALLGPSYHVLNEKTDLTPGGSEWWFDPRRGSEKTFLKALGELAAKSGHPELETIPWALWGHSGGGIWSDVMTTLHPERVIAAWLRSGSAAMFRSRPEFPQPEVPAAAHGVPAMCNPGAREQPNTPWRGPLATFQEYRAKGAPIGFAPDPRTGHECGDCRYLAIPFFDACLAMRLPDKGSQNQALKPVDLSQGWLAPLLGEEAQPAAAFKGDAQTAVWLPNEAVAKAWMEYVKTGAVSDTTPPPAPFDVRVSPKGDQETEISWNAEADFESGIRNFIVLRDGQALAQVPPNPMGKFGRPLFQSMTYHDTPSQPLPQMQYVDSSARPGEKHTYTVIAVNSVGLKSEPSGAATPGEKKATGAAASIYRPAGGRGEMTLWYRQPAVKWLEALPLGNGLTAAMVFGGTKTERIALNNSSFWSGKPHDYDDPNAGKYFDRIKALMSEQKFQEAEKMADDHFWGIPSGQQAYQPIGDLSLAFDGVGEAADYRRELDLETGVATVTYRSGGVSFTRETFISYPDRVLVVRISADKPGSVSVEARLKSPAAFVDKLAAAPGKLVLDGTWRRPSSQTNWLIAPVEGEGLRFEAAMAARAEGGQSEATADSVRIRNADAVTLFLTTATSYINYHDIGGDPAAQCQKVLADCAGKNYAGLRRRHEADFRGLMGRVHLHVGDAAQNDKPIDERLAAVKTGTRDPNLEALVFQLGRYILAASSRAGGQPANLQGIWDEDVLPPWGSKYTININTEMNYWPAEVCNLPECAQPLFDMIQDISETGARTAKVYYGVDGWVTHHNLDLWRGTAPVDAARFGMWPLGGAWLCQSLWEHYAFGGDVEFLKQYYPTLRDCARFLLNIMIVEPKHHWLVTPFSMSPEHGYFDADGKPAVLSPSPTMDVAIMRELFPHCIEASKILGVDAEFRARLEDALTKIPPYQIGSSGFVQEWIEDWKTGPQGHNVSPNFAFYPGSSITLRGNPEFAAAYQKWMEAHRPGGGFILSWGIAMWARLERGDQVAKCIETYMGRCPAPNLHNAGANQSDASFGFTAAVAEGLVQSHAGEISLLPALPGGWSEGSVSGLRARAGYDVSMQWKNGKLQAADLRNLKGGAVKVRYGQKTETVTLKPGEAAHLNAELAPAN